MNIKNYEKGVNLLGQAIDALEKEGVWAFVNHLKETHRLLSDILRVEKKFKQLGEKQ